MKRIITLLLIFTSIWQYTNAQTARVQVIHNCADLAADTVDVWLDNTKLLDNFAFRTASPFINAPAGVNFDVRIQPKTSTDTIGSLARFTYNLTAGQTYVLVASGIVSPTGYSPVQPFDIKVYAGAREAATMGMNTDILVLHGSTDAPIVDVEESTAGSTLIDNLPYGGFNGYLSLPASADYTIDVTDASGSTIVARYGVPLNTLNLDGAAITVVASGFLNPSVNSGGPSFGLWVALPTGGNLIALPFIAPARVQVIHNCADLAADTVDVWYNNTLLLDNFAFRTASSYVDVPATTDFDISVQPKNSADTTGALARFTYNLAAGEKYVLVASGIVSPSGYSPVQPFDIKVYAGAREGALVSTNTDILVMHGSTDAPVVDVEESTGGSTLVNDLAYGSFNGYLSLPASTDYSIDITDATGSTIVARYGVPLNTLGLDGEALTVLASGFLNPGANSGGPDFGLWVALAAGGNLIALPSIPTSIQDEVFSAGLSIYPNPARDILNLEGELSLGGMIEFQVLDMTGRTIASQSMVSGAGSFRASIPVESLPEGMYILSVNNGNKVSSRLFSVAR